jgi:hypothetical protein
VLSAAVVLAMVTGVYAQGKANFAGKWTRDAEKTASANPAMAAGGGGGGGRAGGGAGGGGGDMTIAQDAKSLTITRTTQAGETKSVYNLDAEGKNMGGRDGTTEIPYKCKVAGATISVETTQQGQNGATVTTTVYSMEGDWLVTAATRPGRDGAPATTKTYYKKAM